MKEILFSVFVKSRNQAAVRIAVENQNQPIGIFRNLFSKQDALLRFLDKPNTFRRLRFV
jgi:hypothetical protein